MSAFRVEMAGVSGTELVCVLLIPSSWVGAVCCVPRLLSGVEEFSPMKRPP